MIGWSIVLGVSLILGIVSNIMYLKYYDIEILTLVLCTVFYGLAFVIVLTMAIIPITYRQEINTFKEYETLLEEVYDGGSVEDTAINVQVIELNKWLSSAKASKQTYGIFSFYPKEIEDFKYLTIKEE
jgi:hypothetical protein